MFREGNIIRVVGGTREDVNRLLQIDAAEVSVNAKDMAPQLLQSSPDQADAAAEPAVIAVRAARKGSLHEFFWFGPESSPTSASAESGFQQWADNERSRASQIQGSSLQDLQYGDPQLPNQAWTEINQITNSTSNDSGITQVTVGIYRLVEVDSSSDWYMVQLNPLTQPNAQCAVNSVAAACNSVTLNRSFSLSTSGAKVSLADHGPTATLTTSSVNFMLGFSLTPAGPGVSASITESWQQPSVTTTDQTNVVTGLPAWYENFNFGNPVPSTMTTPFLSHQGAIFQVPEDTASFNLSARTETQFGNCFQFGQNRPSCNVRNAVDVDFNLKIAAPTLSVTPSKVSLKPGGTMQLQVNASIPSSTVGVPWVLSNVPEWLTVSQTSGSTSTTLTLTASPDVSPGTVASLNINTAPAYAAPSVEGGPLVVPVTVSSAQATTTTTLGSNINPSNVGQLVRFQARVASKSQSGTPTGTVTFMEGNSVLGSGALDAGVAQFETTSLAAGLHSIVAAYQGTTDFAASQSAAYPQSVSGPSRLLKL